MAASVLWEASPTGAACHFFTVDVSPPTAPEGSAVEVTIERDAAVVPSSVRVATADGSAVAGEDYTAFDERVEFNSGTTQTVTIQTTSDTTHEPDETFTVELSEGEGCEVNQNFGYGPPAVITIADDDTAPTEPPPDRSQPTTNTTAATPQPATTTSATETTDVAERVAATTEATSTTIPTTTGATDPDAVSTSTPDVVDSDEEALEELTPARESDGIGLAPVIAVVLLLAAGSAAVYLSARRRLNR